MNNMIKNKGTVRREIKQIAVPNSRHVTFSKRRIGLFKKASELCVLTGAECAVLCESLGGRLFAFGHPSVESVVDKFLGSSELSEDDSVTDVSSPCMHEHDELKKQYLEIVKEIEIEKNKSVQLMRGKNEDFDISGNMEKAGLFWWQQPFDHLGVEELEDYLSSMEQLANNLKFRANDLMVLNSSSLILGADKALKSNFTGLSLSESDESLANKYMATKDSDGQLDELLVDKKVNFSDDSLLDGLLVIKDEELDGALNYLELRDHVEQVPNVYGNTTGIGVQLPHYNGDFVVPDDYGRAVDVHNFDAAGVLPQ